MYMNISPTDGLPSIALISSPLSGRIRSKLSRMVLLRSQESRRDSSRLWSVDMFTRLRPFLLTAQSFSQQLSDTVLLPSCAFLVCASALILLICSSIASQTLCRLPISMEFFPKFSKYSHKSLPVQHLIL